MNEELARNLLKYTYVFVPVVAGLDKFFNLLVDWSSYISPFLENIIPFGAATFMVIVGIIEISAGLIVLTKTELGAYIVSAWLVLISLNLAILGSLDIAVRDLAMAVGAYSLALLSK